MHLKNSPSFTLCPHPLGGCVTELVVSVAGCASSSRRGFYCAWGGSPLGIAKHAAWMDFSAVPCYATGAVERYLETVLKEDVQEVFDHFCACFNIRILFYSPTGKQLKVGLNRP